MSPHSVTTVAESWRPDLRRRWQSRKSPLFAAERAFGRFHWWTDGAGIADPLPSQRTFPRFLQHLRETGDPCQAKMLKNLLTAVKVLAPERDWGWLREQRQRAAAAARQRPRANPYTFEPRVTVPLSSWRKDYQERFLKMYEKPLARDEFAHTLARTKRVQCAPVTLNHFRARYSRWLFSMRRSRRSEDVTYENMKFYVEEMERQGLTRDTICLCVDGVLGTMSIVEPEGKWHWLAASLGNLRAFAAQAPKRKQGRFVNPAELWELGLLLISLARRMEETQPKKAAAQFRNGLILCMFASVPVRLGCHQISDFKKHLILEGKTGWLVFGATETKERSADTRMLSEELVALLREWRDKWRKLIANSASGQAVWIGKNGRRMSPAMIRRVLTVYTSLHLGIRIWPHLVRDCVATLIKQHYPDEAQVAVHILHHGSSSTTRRYQRECRQLVVQKRAMELINQRHRELRRECAGRQELVA